MKKYKKDREIGKLELKDILETEDLNWREKMIKDHYYWAKKYTSMLVNCLERLDIPMFNYKEDYYYYRDIEETFVERVVPAPDGWRWEGETVELK